MVLKDILYNVLVVSDVEAFNNNIKTFLPEYRFHNIDFATSINEGKLKYHERYFDMIIINAPLSDDPGIEFAIELSGSENTAVLFSVSNAYYPQVRDKLVGHGIICLQRPTSGKAILQAIDDLCSLREKLRGFEKKSVSVDMKMKEIRLVNKAKWLLIEKQHMTEAEAHRYIEQQSMKLSVSKSKLSEQLIENLS